jgi:hypothetical protein
MIDFLKDTEEEKPDGVWHSFRERYLKRLEGL